MSIGATLAAARRRAGLTVSEVSQHTRVTEPARAALDAQIRSLRLTCVTLVHPKRGVKTPARMRVSQRHGVGLG